MVLSDAETKQFYQKFGELEKEIKGMKEKSKKAKLLKQVQELGLFEVETLVEEIHNIVYEVESRD